MKRKRARYLCLGLLTLIVVDNEGDAYPCSESLAAREKSALKLGDILNLSLIDLHSSVKYHSIREAHLEGRHDKFPECMNCDFWSSAPGILRRGKDGTYR